MPVLAILKYWREIAIGLFVVAIICFFLWIRHIVSENQSLKQTVKDSTAKVEAMEKKFDSYVQLNKEIASAISNIKIKSNNYVTAVEKAPLPMVAPGHSINLIPGGVLSNMSSSSISFTNRSSSSSP